jgi:Asp-tRNA(Asn)/Glu-tRNA(Gln) amidotransferase A subunit family amidase
VYVSLSVMVLNANLDVLDDPGLFHNAPVSLQLIGRPFQDEKLLACAAIVDKVVNGTRF